jgi:putative oxidoreductase
MNFETPFTRLKRRGHHDQRCTARKPTLAVERRGSVRTSAASTASAVDLVPLGRLLFTLIFLESVPGHFSSQTIAYAAHQGTPLASVLVPLSGILALLGGLSVLLGYHARVGAFLLALFLIPVTLVMHPFWAVPEAAAQLQRIMWPPTFARPRA